MVARVTSVPAPVLASSDFDVANSAGGDDITLTGTNLGIVSDDVIIDRGGPEQIAPTVVSNDGSTLVFTMPPMDPGIYTVDVETAGGISNTLTLIVEADPVVWLDAARATVVGVAATGVPNSAQSAVDLSVTQATSGKQPTYDATYADLGDQPAIVSASADPDTSLYSAILGTGLEISQPMTIYAVVKKNTTFSYIMDDVDGSQRVAILGTTTGGAGRAYVVVNGGEIYGGPADLDGRPVVWCVVLSGTGTADSDIYINDATTPFVADQNAGSGKLESIRMGNRFSEDSALDGAWSVLGVFEGEHDSTTRGRFMPMLVDKYSIPPFIYSLNYNVTDPAGGASITITGSVLDSATSVTVGGTSATITANTSTSLTFTMPAKAAGSHNVIVTNANGASNTLSIEAWSPEVEATCNLFVEKPDYSMAGANGTWTARVGGDLTQVSVAPAAVAGEPVFATNKSLDSSEQLSALFSTTEGTAMLACKPTAHPAYSSSFASPALLSIAGGVASFSLSLTDVSGTDKYIAAIYDGGGYKEARVSAAYNVMRSVVVRFEDSVSIELSVDGKKNDGTAGFESTAIGSWTSTSGVLYVGQNYDGSAFLDGTVRAVALFDEKVADAVATKWNTYARCHYGTA